MFLAGVRNRERFKHSLYPSNTEVYFNFVCFNFIFEFIVSRRSNLPLLHFFLWIGWYWLSTYPKVVSDFILHCNIVEKHSGQPPNSLWLAYPDVFTGPTNKQPQAEANQRQSSYGARMRSTAHLKKLTSWQPVWEKGEILWSCAPRTVPKCPNRSFWRSGRKSTKNINNYRWQRTG